MPQQMSQAQLDVARNFYNQGDLVGMYSYLSSLDYKYADLALGVVRGDTLSGVVALEFMQRTAENQGKILLSADIDLIRSDMALGYLDTLQTQIDVSGFVTRDITAAEATIFHNDSFVSNGLAIDAWTLNTPFSFMTIESQEAYWNSILETAGDLSAEIELAVKTSSWMALQETLLPTEISAELEEWRLRIEDTDTIFGILGAGFSNFTDFLTSGYSADTTDGVDNGITRENGEISTNFNSDTLTTIDQNGIEIISYQLDNDQISNSIINVPTDSSAGLFVDVDLTNDSYIVSQGDTLSQIANDFGVSLNDLILANPQINNPDLIYVDQIINVPGLGLDTGPNNSFLEVNTNNIFDTAFSDLLSDTSLFDDTNSGILGSGSNFGFIAPDNIVNGSGLANTLTGDFITDGIRPGDFNISSADSFLDSLDNSLNIDSWVNGDSTNIFNIGSEALTLDFTGINTTFIDPLILDLNGDGVILSNYVDAGVLFDIDNDTSLEQTGWVSSTDGILVVDINGNGVIDDSSEMISEYFNGATGTPGNEGEKLFTNGFDALASLDTDADGLFSAADGANWSLVQTWIDANSDGVTDAGELFSLDSLGITSVNLNTTTESGAIRGGNEVLASGIFTINTGAGVEEREAIAANFLTDPNGAVFSQDATGITGVSDEGGSVYVSNVATGEVIDVAVRGVDSAYGAAGDDTLTGDAGNNWLGGGAGSDTFNAGAGDDVLLIDAADVASNIDGGDGFDIAIVTGNEGVTLNLADSNLELVDGGRGNDTFIGGGRSNVFIRGGDGNDIIIGGGADDVLSGEDGRDYVVGGAGNDIVRGHRGDDRLVGGAGDDVIDGGLDDDKLYGGAGNDVLIGGQGDDIIDAGAGFDVAQYSGSFGEYRITQSEGGVWVADTVSGRDGTDFLVDVERLTFSDLSSIELSLDNPMPVKDILDVPFATGSSAPHLILQDELLANDIDYQNDDLQITALIGENDLEVTTVGVVLQATGGTVQLTAAGDVLFTPDANFTGVMSFQYRVADADGTPGAQAVLVDSGLSEEMRAAVYLRTTDQPSDPLFTDQWYISDANIMPVWQDYTGEGVRIGMFEPGSEFAVAPQIFDYRHPDLAPNVDSAWFSSGDAITDFSNHATLVAGVMVAANNGEGAVGVAYDASLSGFYISNDGSDLSALNNLQDFDIANNSWGVSPDFSANFLSNAPLEAAFEHAAAFGRDGLGTVMVFAAGNDRANGGNANSQNLANNRFVIATGAINAGEDLGALVIGQDPFSNPGANILVSAPGSNVTSTSRLLSNDNGSVFGNAFEATQGTSFATPIVSGIVALMLEANPNLGYRDVKEILALTARQVDDPNTVWDTNGSNNWNGGGMTVSNDYGFGNVDALAAVRLAETWTRQSNYFNEYIESASSGDLNLAVTDNGTITQSLNIDSGLLVEHAEVVLDIDHERWGDLIVTLISPDGTRSVLMDRAGKAPGDATDVGDTRSGQLNFTFGSEFNWGEESGGIWQLEVTDANGGAVGTLNNWTLNLYGRNDTGDDNYVYTNEYQGLASGSRATLVDSDGGVDTVNAAAISGDSNIDLNAGASSSLGGAALNIAIGTNIENAFTGDGNDTITGNASDNLLSGGRGSDVITGGAGQDIIDGGRGANTLTGGADNDFFVVRENAGETDTITDFQFGSELIALIGFGATTFTDLVITQEGAHSRVSLVNGQSILVQNTTASNLTQNQFQFLDDFNFSSVYVGTDSADPEVSGSGFGGGLYLGGAGDDRIFGGAGLDEIHGGAGDDVLVGEFTNSDTFNDLKVVGAGDRIMGDEGNDTVSGGVRNDQLFGGSGNDVIQGGAGDDVIRGGSGKDVVRGGKDNDTIYVEGGDDQLTGTDFAEFGDIYFGNEGADRFVITPDSSVNVGSGALRNVIGDFSVTEEGEKIDFSELTYLTSFDDLAFSEWTINGGPYLRVEVGGGQSGQYIMLANVSRDDISADNFIFAEPSLTGGVGNDEITGNAGGNRIDGGAGADVMVGRTGDDTYVVDNVGDTIVELIGGGFDSVESSVNWALDSEVENLTLTGSNDLNAIGNNSTNRIVGNAGNNILDGQGGADFMLGGAGNDTYIVDNSSDSITEQNAEGVDSVQSLVSYTLSENVENLTLTGSDSVNATGNDQNNILTGNANDNTLDGGRGADSLVGGAGDDTYLVDELGDSITELLGEGNDTVYAGINYTLDTNVDNLVLTGFNNLNGTGNVLDNSLRGNSGNNVLTGGAGDDVLDGGTGADTLIGGSGNDTYIISELGDTVTEGAGGGVDTVRAGIDFTLADKNDLENIYLTGADNLNATGNAVNNLLVGNVGDNRLTGGDGDDVLDGGRGTDRLEGGRGDDIYYVDSSTDSVIERANEGTDTILSSVSMSLIAQPSIENLSLTGSSSINATGNDQDNILIGNNASNSLIGGGGNDRLDGGLGNDTLFGGEGNDTYVVNNSGDVVDETGGGGIDTVESSVNLALSAGVENLVLTGSAVTGTGNALNNTLTGNDSLNVLDGGAGSDQMTGGLGDDIYVVDNVSDTVIELAGEGRDVIQSSVDQNVALAANVENLVLTGSASVGTGNTLDNAITGNSSANILSGGAGDDLLIGRTGNDTYLFSLGDGRDEIVDLDLTAGNIDRVRLLDINLADVTIVKDPTHLIINVDATTDQLRMRWSPVDGYEVEEFEFADGTVLTAAQLQNNIAYTPDIAQPIVDVSAVEDSLFSFIVPAGTFSDANVGDTLSYSARLADGSVMPTWLSFNAVTREFSGTPVNSDVGNIDVEVIATDNTGLSASDTFNLSISNTNDAPIVANTIAPQVATEDGFFDFTVPVTTFTDIDIGDSLSLSATQVDGSALPAWLIFNPSTGRFTGVPDNAAVGNLQVRVIATDVAGLSVNTAFTLTVNNTNDGPTVAVPITDQSALEDSPFNFAIPAGTFNDIDAGDSMTVSASLEDGSSLPPWLVFDSATGVFSGTPPQGTNGDISVRVTDVDTGGLSASDVFNIAIADAPAAVNGTVGVDYLQGSSGRDIFDGLAGDDILVGDEGDDIYLFGRSSGNDTIEDFDTNTGNIDIVRFSADVLSTDVTVSRGSYFDLHITINDTRERLTLSRWLSSDATRIERIEFSDVTWNAQALRNQIIDAGDGDDFVTGDAGDNVLNGYEGADRLLGLDGNDTLDGGSGDDAITGGGGNDIFLFGRGSGRDIIHAEGGGSSVGNDTVLMAADLTPDDVTLSRDELNLFLRINNTADRLNISNWFGSFSGVDQIQFNDGTIWDAAYVNSVVNVSTINDDILTGGSGVDILSGLAGNDFLSGANGDDILDGGVGNDQLNGSAGNDTYLFAPGFGADVINDSDFSTNSDVIRFAAGILPVDILVSRTESDLVLSVANTTDSITISGWFTSSSSIIESIEFDNGTVWGIADIDSRLPLASTGDDFLGGTSGADTIDGLDGNDLLQGEEGDDTLIGGAGNDILEGSRGNDTYVFGIGSGSDRIRDWDAFNDTDTISFGAGLLPENVSVSRIENNLVLNIGSSGDSLTIERWFEDSRYQIDQLQFDNGVIWDVNNINTILSGPGSTGSDTIVGSSANDNISGLAGDDILFGGNDGSFFGVTGDDVINGGTGNDLLIGGNGSDTYIFNPGDGQDTLVEVSDFTANTDVLQFGPGILPADVVVTREIEDLHLSIGSGDRVNIQNWFRDITRELEQIIFDDGTVWLEADIFSRLSGATIGDDAVTGTAAADVIDGLSGDDALFGEDGNDTLNDASGNDVLYGGLGSDVYIFGRGYGKDSIVENTTGGSNGLSDSDILRFTAGVQPEDIVVTRDDNNLYLGIKGSTDVVTLVDWLRPEFVTHQVQQVEFANGAVWYREEIIEQYLDGTRTPAILNEIVDSSATEELFFTQAMPQDFILQTSDAFTLSAALSSGGALPVWLAFDAATGVFSGTPGNQDVGILSLAVTATGSDGEEISDEFFLEITDTNDAPYVFNNVADQQVSQDKIFELVLAEDTFRDDDYLDELSLNATLTDDSALPSWLNFNPQLMRFSGTPGAEDVGNVSVRVTAVDRAGVSISDDFQITISDVNDAPIVTSPIVDQQVDELTPFNFVLPAATFTDLDAGDVLTYSAQFADGSALPTWLAFDAATRTFNGTPSGGDTGLLNVRVTVTDTSLQTVSNDFALRVGLVGTQGDDTLMAATGRSILGLAGNDILVGSLQADNMQGGDGNDNYIVNHVGDTITENLDEGVDTVQSSIDHTLSANVENLSLTSAANINGAGNTEANVLIGNSGINILNGLEGDDQIYGAGGNDLLVGDGGDDTIYGGTGNDALNGGLGSDYLNGGAGNDVIILDGDIGSIDSSSSAYSGTRVGGADADTYVLSVSGNGVSGVSVDTAGLISASNLIADFDVNVSGEVIDLTAFSWIQSFSDITVSSKLLGSVEITTLTATDGANSVYVNLAGVSPSQLNAGHFVLAPIVNNAPVLAVAQADQTAVEDALFNYTLAASTFTDVDAEDTLTYSATLLDGTALPTWLNFNAVTQTFSGTPTNTEVGSLDITVVATDVGGLTASDTFTVTVNNVNDAPVVTVAQTDQTATEDAAFNYTLAAGTFTDVDAGDTLTYSATLSGGAALPSWLSFNAATQAFSGTPINGDIGTLNINVVATDSGGLSVTDAFSLSVNAANQGVIVGTINDDVLNGVSSDDLIQGLEGNDVLYGNGGDDLLEGGDGNDILIGGTGADAMTGGLGDDIYVIDDIGDTIIEQANEGVDQVFSSISYTLGAEVENLTLSGGLNNNAMGNASANVLTGNTGNNLLFGNGGDDTLNGGLGVDVLIGGVGADAMTGGLGDDILFGNEGDDTLNGGLGVDILSGGAGDDQYLFNSGSGQDQIIDAIGNDRVVFGNLLSANQLWFEQDGTSLYISVIGQQDSISINDWYDSDLNHIETFQTDNGLTLDHTLVDQLVSSMASFGVTDPAQFTPTSDQQLQIDQLISVNWQAP